MRKYVVGAMVIAVALGGLGLLASVADAPRVPERPAQIDTTPSLHLAEQVPFTSLTIPQDSRDGLPLSDVVQIEGPWEPRGQNHRGGWLWAVPNPFRPRGMFFNRPQEGMMLVQKGMRRVPYRMLGGGGGVSWRHDENELLFNTRLEEQPPPTEFHYPKAVKRERRLHYREALAAGWVKDEASFVRGATVQDGWVSRQGLLLPAPAQATWNFTVPEAGQLTMSPGLVRPEFADLAPSDGCEIVVRIGEGEASEQIYARTFTPGEFTQERVDLSKWAGKEVTLAMETRPGATSRNDFCFVGAPIVSKKKEHPRRVILVFVDTLRADHLSIGGYARDTTPNLKALADRGVLFSQARSVAPWTLPSTRSVITGYQPELYDRVETLPKRLGREGFATGMIAGNVYLSANFDMNRDWDHHEVGMFPPADQVTDRALEWLEQHEGEDSLLQVHYMSAHLPYLEPIELRTRYAGGGPAGLEGEFHLPAVRKANLDEDGKAYIRDRYDNCIYWIDRELQRLYAQLEPEDILVFYSDHGEEFWDHGGYEHGHTLYDELLRVPLVIKAPGLPAGRVDAPVSLLDITPTVLDLLGFDGPSQGASLVKAAQGDPATLKALAERPQAVGRPLYGREQWGVVADSKKWISIAGREQVYDLVGDPGEQADLFGSVELGPFREAIGEALDTRPGVGYRFAPTRNSSYAKQTDLKVHVPGGVGAAWFGADALQQSRGTLELLDEETVLFTWHQGYRGTREAYVIPKKPVAEVTHQLSFEVRQAQANFRPIAMQAKAPVEPGPDRLALHTLNLQDGNIVVTWAVVPVVDEAWMALDATDSETSDWLQELGYVPREEDEKPE